VIAHRTSAQSSGNTDINGVVATAASGSRSAADLGGKTVAVTMLDGWVGSRRADGATDRLGFRVAEVRCSPPVTAVTLEEGPHRGEAGQ
jgi:hypothetical protein